MHLFSSYFHILVEILSQLMTSDEYYRMDSPCSYLLLSTFLREVDMNFAWGYFPYVVGVLFNPHSFFFHLDSFRDEGNED